MCGPKTYQQAVANFANTALVVGSPLYTISMLFSTQVDPRAQRDFWGSEELQNTWRRHLAAIINNRSRGWDTFGVALGDQLLRIGQVEAAHFCFVFCGVQVASLAQRGARLTLVGCDLSTRDLTLMTEEAIAACERTEAYEWAKRLGNPNATIKCLQAFKLMYAILLADYGFEDSARSYVQSIAACLGEKASHKELKSHGLLSLSIISSDTESVLAELGEFEQRLSRGHEVLSGPPAKTSVASRQNLGGKNRSQMSSTENATHGASNAVAEKYHTPMPETAVAAPKSVPTSSVHLQQQQVSQPRVEQPPPRREQQWQQPLDSIGEESTSAPTQPPKLPPMQPVTARSASTPVGQTQTEGLPPRGPPASVSTPTPMPAMMKQAPDSTPVTPISGTPEGMHSASSTEKPESAPMSAPANLNQGSKHASPPSSGKSKYELTIFFVSFSGMGSAFL